LELIKEGESVTIQIRRTLVTLVRMINLYGKHLSAFKSDSLPEELPRITYLEKQDEITL
jgi:hypothetical protein